MPTSATPWVGALSLRTLQPLVAPDPQFPDLPGWGCGKGHGIAQKPRRGKASSLQLLEGDRL